MFRRVLHVAILIASVAVSGCGSKSGGSSVTGPGSTPTDPTAIALSAAFLPLQNNLITPNAPHYASAGVMGAFIPGVIFSPAPNLGPSECIPSQFHGVTYDFNGSGYVATELTGAPANGPRFLLYPLNAQGVPVLGTSSGHLDLTCEPTPTLSPNASSYAITLFANNVVIVSAQIQSDPGNTIVTGTLSDPSGATSIPYASQIYESFPGEVYEDLTMGPYSGIEIRHLRNSSSSNETVTDGLIVQPEGSLPDWIVDVQIRANLAHAISNGGLLVSGPQLQNALAACISGVLGAPVFSPQQTANCNYTPNGGTIDITNADANVYQGIYRDGRRVFDLVQALARTVHQPLPPI